MLKKLIFFAVFFVISRTNSCSFSDCDHEVIARDLRSYFVQMAPFMNSDAKEDFIDNRVLEVSHCDGPCDDHYDDHYNELLDLLLDFFKERRHQEIVEILRNLGAKDDRNGNIQKDKERRSAAERQREEHARLIQEEQNRLESDQYCLGLKLWDKQAGKYFACGNRDIVIQQYVACYEQKLKQQIREVFFPDEIVCLIAEYCAEPKSLKLLVEKHVSIPISILPKLPAQIEKEPAAGCGACILQ